MKYVITYDLNKQGQNYEDLINAIKKYTCFHAMQSVWFVKSNQSSSQINDFLKQYIDKNDNLFVSEVTSNRSGWLSQASWDFLNS